VHDAAGVLLHGYPAADSDRFRTDGVGAGVCGSSGVGTGTPAAGTSARRTRPTSRFRSFSWRSFVSVVRTIVALGKTGACDGELGGAEGVLLGFAAFSLGGVLSVFLHAICIFGLPWGCG
jgi:hypothetical protein